MVLHIGGAQKEDFESFRLAGHCQNLVRFFSMERISEVVVVAALWIISPTASLLSSGCHGHLHPRMTKALHCCAQWKEWRICLSPGFGGCATHLLF